jgi:hypothetical protein
LVGVDTDPEQLMTASGAACILGRSRDMVRILSHKGDLAAVQATNGYHFFKRQDVEALARKRAQARADRGKRPIK